MNKLHLLEQLEKDVNRHLDEAVKVFQNMHTDALLKPAANGGWSIAQCLEHLNRYGDYYLPLLEKGLALPYPSADTFTSTWLGNFFTNMMKAEKKTKAFKAYTPAPDLNAAAVVAEFIRQQEVLLSCLSLARTANLNKIKIPVSIAKWIKLKAGDVLQFVVAHNERHIKQAGKNCQINTYI